MRKSPLDRFNLERADRLAQQTRKETRGIKRRWTLKESEAQRWPTMGATARLRWLARVETKGKKRSQEQRNAQKRQGAETPPRKRTRATEERLGEVKGEQGPLEQWLSRGSPSGPRQVEREDVPGTSSENMDGASATTQSATHERREGIGNNIEGEKRSRVSNRRKIDKKAMD